MFEHFTFAAQALPADQHEDISPSPTDTSFPSPVSATQQTPWSPYQQDTVDGIAHKFSLQSLRPEDDELSQQSIWHDREESLPAPDFDQDVDTDFTQDEMTYISTTCGMFAIPAPMSASTQSLPDLPTLPHPRGGTLACRRLQRQLNVQLQASSSHIRDINALVEDMIVTNSQCNLHKSTSRPYLSSPPPSRAGPEELVIDTTEFPYRGRNMGPDEDEGFSEIADEDWGVEEEMTLRRASTPSGIRKYGMIRYRGSADCVSAINAAGRMKVKSVPRMRRRKPKSVPE